jgi:hypothetical protein
MSGYCSGNFDDHCCHLGKYGVCKYLEKNATENRIWTCSLRRELGDWDLVHNDERYVSEIKVKLLEYDLPNCGDWPRQNERCAVCGVIG